MDDEAGESLIIADRMLVRKGGEGRKRVCHSRDEMVPVRLDVLWSPGGAMDQKINQEV